MHQISINNVEHIFENYIRNSTARGMASAKTWIVYKRGMAVFIKYMLEYDLDIKNLNTANIEHYRRYLIEQGNKPRTIMVRLASIRVLFKAMIRAGLIKKDPTVSVKAPKIDTPTHETIARKIIMPQPFAQVLSMMGNSFKDRRDKAMLLIMYMLGLRVSEIADLKISDYKNGKIEFISKGNKKRALPVPDMLQSSLCDYLSDFNDHDRMFDISVRGIQKMVKARFKKIGHNISPHSLRHSCATVSAINNASPFAIQDQLGHESQKTTGLYTKIAGRFMKSPAIIMNEVLKCA